MTEKEERVLDMAGTIGRLDIRRMNAAELAGMRDLMRREPRLITASGHDVRLTALGEGAYRLMEARKAGLGLQS